MIKILYVAAVVIGVSGCAIGNPHSIERLVHPRILQETLFDSDAGLIVCTWTNDVHALFRVSLPAGTIQELGAVDAHRIFPNVSSDGKLLAYCEKKPKEKSIIQIMNLESGETRTIEDENDDLLWPRFSADAKMVVYTAHAKDGSSSIRMYDLEKDTVDVLTSNDSLDAFPQFYTDDSNVTFMGSRRFGHASFMAPKDYHDWFLYRIDLESRQLWQMTEHKRYRIPMRPPIQSEKYILFYDIGYMTGDVFWLYDKIDPFDPQEIRLSEDDFKLRDSADYGLTQMRNPVFSPDGNQILFPMGLVWHVGAYSEPSELYLYDLESQGITKLTELGYHIYSAAYSPDGSRIAFLADAEPINRKNPLSLWIMNSDGSDLKMLRDTW